MNAHEKLMAKLQAWADDDDSGMITVEEIELDDALIEYKAAPPPLVLEAVDEPEPNKLIADLGVVGEYAFVMYNNKCYRLKDGG